MEDMGFSCLLVPNHFNDRFAALPAPLYAASATTTVHVRTILADNDYRYPMILAKEVATIDVLLRVASNSDSSWNSGDATRPDDHLSAFSSKAPWMVALTGQLPGETGPRLVDRRRAGQLFRSERNGLSHNSHLPYSSAGSGGDRCLARTISAIEPDPSPRYSIIGAGVVGPSRD